MISLTHSTAGNTSGRTLFAGHLASIFTVLTWGTTFISTKVLLEAFSPIEILMIRFVIGYLALWFACPRILHVQNRRQELTFAAAGLCGVTLYYLLENIALTCTMTSHVSVIVSTAPFFTALLASRLPGEEKPGLRFFLGFLLAIAGIGLISFQGSGDLSLQLTGDLLSLAAAVIWAIYSILTKQIGEFGCSVLQSTRRTFFYGILFMLPAMPFLDFSVSAAELLKPVYLANLTFLGFVASAMCFATWNFAVRSLGTVKTSVYIYGVPVITTIASALILDETITAAAVLGIILTLAGLAISQNRTK